MAEEAVLGAQIPVSILKRIAPLSKCWKHVQDGGPHNPRRRSSTSLCRWGRRTAMINISSPFLILFWKAT